jgi:hypothetical protein
VNAPRPVLAALAAAALLAGCGSSASSTSPRGSAPIPKGPSSAKLRAKLAAATRVSASTFPAAGGHTLRELADAVDGTGPQISFATQTLTPGQDRRLAFGVVDAKTGFVYAPTAIYIADSENAKARGPYPAPADLLITDPPFRSQNAATESDPFAAIYETVAPLPKAGTFPVLAVSMIAGKQIGAAGSITVVPAGKDPIPHVGQQAPRIATDTLASAGGDVTKIDTRRPPSDMHAVSLKDALGKKPVALLFATPQLCQSRVCGPVVDIAAQLEKTYGDRMTFIHQEVYRDNEVAKGLRKPLVEFKLQTEPWLFVIDRTGKITARLEGSFGFRAFEAAIKTGLTPPRRRAAPGARAAPRDGAGTGGVHVIGRRQRDAEAARLGRFGLAEEAHVHGRVRGERGVDAVEDRCPRGGGEDDGTGPGGREQRHLAVRDREAQDRADVQRELAEHLRGHRHHAGVVRAGGDLAEEDVVALDEELDAEDACAPERIGDPQRDGAGAGECGRRHRLGLPGLAVVAVDLRVADRRAERRAAGVTDGQQRDLVVEVDEAFDDDGAGVGAGAGLRDVPGGLPAVRRADDRLALAR